MVPTAIVSAGHGANMVLNGSRVPYANHHYNNYGVSSGRLTSSEGYGVRYMVHPDILIQTDILDQSEAAQGGGEFFPNFFATVRTS
jgi:hypothetical protein